MGPYEDDEQPPPQVEIEQTIQKRNPALPRITITVEDQKWLREIGAAWNGDKRK